MRIESFRVVGIRCFEDSGDIVLSNKINVFVGRNNSGKSTLLKSLLAFQGFPFSDDKRSGSPVSYHSINLTDVFPNNYLRIRSGGPDANFQIVRRIFQGAPQASPAGIPFCDTMDDIPYFNTSRPSHFFVPFLARRKAAQLDQNITAGFQAQVTGTFSNLTSRIDLIASGGHPRHAAFDQAVREIIGLQITTKSSVNGKESGFYIDDDNFVNLDKMGDGVTEMVALIVELCLEKGKVFVLEEPETNIHPKGLKALLNLIRYASEHNQFIIATHSNIVVRELGFDTSTKVFRVGRDETDLLSASTVEIVPKNPSAHIALLRELGYEFADFRLHDAWLFLEESSAEQIIEQILVPNFAPALIGKLRTYSAGGVTNIEPRVDEFQHLVTFVHLQPAYEGRLWIRPDGDAEGEKSVRELRDKFKYLTEDTCSSFSEPAFERYYPKRFSEQIDQALSIKDKKTRKVAKFQLLKDVLDWSKDTKSEILEAWKESAGEPINLLQKIEKSIS